MTSARPAPILDADFEEIGDQRRADRRASDRRAPPRRRFDPLFAATLVNQITKSERTPTQGYAAPCSSQRNGMVVNLRA